MRNSKKWNQCHPSTLVYIPQSMMQSNPRPCNYNTNHLRPHSKQQSKWKMLYKSTKSGIITANQSIATLDPSIATIVQHANDQWSDAFKFPHTSGPMAMTPDQTMMCLLPLPSMSKLPHKFSSLHNIALGMLEQLCYIKAFLHAAQQSINTERELVN